MSRVARAATERAVALLRAADGLPAEYTDVVSELGGRWAVEEQVAAQQIAGDTAERELFELLPRFQVHCEWVKNTLRERFRVFSGPVRLVVEARISDDRVERLQEPLQQAVQAITNVLDRNRGDWGDGMFYGGAYEVKFEAARRGGRHFVQTARVSFELEVSAG